MPNQVNILEVLEEYKVQVKEIANGHAKIICPFHGDLATPSLSISLEDGENRGRCHCFGCGINTGFVQLLERYHIIQEQAGGRKNPGQRALAVWLAKKYDLTANEPSLDPKIIDGYCENFHNSPDLKKELYRRYIRDEEILKYRLGQDNSRITIPIDNEFGNYVNVIKYLPNASSNKMQGMASRNENRLYPVDQLKFSKIILTAGPIKAIAGSRLNCHGYGAVTQLQGESAWDNKFNQYFKDKEVYVIYDIDEAGQMAAMKRCADIYPHSRSVCNIELPFQVEKGGLDDYLYRVGEAALLKLLEAASPYEPPQIVSLDNKAPERSTLTAAYKPSNIGKRLEIPVRVTGVCTTPYHVPKTFEVHCTKDAKPQGTCSLCPVYQHKGTTAFTKSIHPESRAMLLCVEKSDAKLRDAMLLETGIPANCTRHTFKVQDYQIVEEIRVSPMMDLQNSEREREDQPALCLTTVDANSSYKTIGRIYPHPDTQRATLVLSSAENLSDDISQWKREHDLTVFQPKDRSVDEQYKQVLLNLERNATKIYQRWEAHAMVDLTLHTPLLFNFRGEMQNGWGQCIIVGDSGQGKSKIVQNLFKYYNVGATVDSANTTIPGLIGGCTSLDSNSKKMFIRWGALPTNHRKALLIEEAGRMAHETILKMTNTRSSGIAQVPKIENKSTKAYTRQFWTANPVSGRMLATYSHGVDAIFEVVRSPSDIRRFDWGMCLSEVDNKPYPDPLQEITLQISQEQFRDGIMFAWTRTPEQILFEDEQFIVDQAEDLVKVYVEDKIPLVNRGEMRIKLAKLASALAIRLFSTTDGETVLVRTVHVQWIVQYLHRIYSDPATGYRKYSDGIRLLNNISEPEYLRGELVRLVHFESIRDGMLAETHIEKQDLMDWGELDNASASSILSKMVRCRALVRKTNRSYVKTPGFANFLREIDRTESEKKDAGRNPTGDESSF